MFLPQPGDYIDIHVHGGQASEGLFIVETLMAHEGRFPEKLPGVAYTYGIHPWHLDDSNINTYVESVREFANYPDVIAIGEAGFDRLRGPSADLQRTALEKQIAISEEIKKPVVIHCVRAWDELLSVHKRLKPQMPWLVHGFRGKIDLASQLISKGMFLSFWFDFIIRPDSANLIRQLPHDRIFLETDGADINIRDIYGKVAADLSVNVEDLKLIILKNFNRWIAG